MEASVNSHAFSCGARLYRYFRHARHRPAGQRYVCAFFWLTLAFLVPWMAGSYLVEEAPFALFAVAVLIIAWSAGAAPALAALAVSVVLMDYFFLPPRQTLGPKAFAEWWVPGGYVLCSLIGILVIESLHRVTDQLRLQQAATEAEIARRRRAEEELNEARRQLRDYALDLEEAVRVRTAELNEAVGFLESFCHSIAHDLRAPARAVNGFAQVLEDGGRLCEEDASYLKRIRDASTRMETLISGLLEYGRLSHTSLSMRQIDLPGAVEAALAPFEPALRSTNASLDIAEDLHPVWSDWTLLQIVLRELIRNALDFVRPGCPLRLIIYTEARDNMVRTWICDNGVGVPAEYRQKIFGLFYTLCRQNLRHVGLGLAIVAKAAERLHGAAGVEESPISGSAFWIDLPRCNWALPSHPRPESALRKGTASVEQGAAN
jgi:signal transduction histidine kinase